jgi:hypothetical protein
VGSLRALDLARSARLAREPLQVASPHELWRLCDGDRALYTHAMEEAGHLRRLIPGQPVPDRQSPCGYCGWQPPTVTACIVDHRTPELAGELRRSIGGPEWLVRLATVDTSVDNVGYAAALHSVFQTAQTPLLLALNADVEFPQEDVADLLALFEEHPRLGLLGVRQRDAKGFIRHAGIERLGDHSGGRAWAEPERGQHMTRYEELEQVSGSIMFIRREAYEQVGGLTHMPQLYYEDALLCHRLRKAGWEVGYSGLHTFVHHWAQSPSVDRGTLAAQAAAAFDAEVGP